MTDAPKGQYWGPPLAFPGMQTRPPSKPDRGLVAGEVAVKNQKGDVVRPVGRRPTA